MIKFKSRYIKKEIELLENLKNNIQEPFIMDAGTLNNELFKNSYKSYEVDYNIHWSVFELMQHITGKDNIWKICEVAFNKDEEWGKWRNRNCLYEIYHKYSLKDEYVKPVVFAIDQWIAELKEESRKIDEEIKMKMQKSENEYKKFMIIKTFKLIMPEGREDGQDGYFDGLIRNNTTGEAIRFVARNVFDFGYYTYPKRLEGKNDIFNREKWTEQEKEIGSWLCKFPPFGNDIRME